MTFGERVKAERRTQGLTQANLALLAKMRQQTVQKIESRKAVRSQYAVAIANALDVHVTWLLDGIGEKKVLATAGASVRERQPEYQIALVSDDDPNDPRITEMVADLMSTMQGKYQEIVFEAARDAAQAHLDTMKEEVQRKRASHEKAKTTTRKKVDTRKD